MRFLFNLLGAVLLAFALVFAVADIARSLADGVARLTTFREAFVAAGLAVEPNGPLSGNVVNLVAAAANWPASVALGLAAFLFLFVGRPAHRRGGRYAR